MIKGLPVEIGTATHPAGAPIMWCKLLGVMLAFAVLALSTYALAHALRSLNANQILQAIRLMPSRKLWLSIGLTCVSFASLGAYDVVAATIVVPHKISAGRAWFGGVLANAISNTLGFHAITGMAVRYRFLSRSGLRGTDIAGVTALSWMALAFGFATLFSLAMIGSSAASPGQRIGGVALLCGLLFFARWLGPGRIMAVRSRTFVLPPGRVALVQMALGAVEMASAIGALYMLMPDRTTIAFPAFSAVYIGAVLLGIASHAPGGLGVFEATMLTIAQGDSLAAIVAALLLYRMVYNFIPFALAALVLAGEEIRVAISSKVDNA